MNIDSSYYKYLKYKQKYLKSKNMRGGGLPDPMYFKNNTFNDVLRYELTPLVEKGEVRADNFKEILAFLDNELFIIEFILKFYENIFEKLSIGAIQLSSLSDELQKQIKINPQYTVQIPATNTTAIDEYIITAKHEFNKLSTGTSDSILEYLYLDIERACVFYSSDHSYCVDRCNGDIDEIYKYVARNRDILHKYMQPNTELNNTDVYAMTIKSKCSNIVSVSYIMYDDSNAFYIYGSTTSILYIAGEPGISITEHIKYKIGSVTNMIYTGASLLMQHVQCNKMYGELDAYVIDHQQIQLTDHLIASTSKHWFDSDLQKPPNNSLYAYDIPEQAQLIKLLQST
jgi:hypothetical protein